MFWDDLMRRWRREHRSLDARLLRGAAGHVAVLPAPRPRRRSRLPWIVIIAALIAGAIWLLQSGAARALVIPA